MNQKLIKYYIDEFLGIVGLRAFVKAARIFKNIEVDDGHFISALKNRSINARNQPIPWITYPAIDYLDQLDFSGKNIFEYGGGNSSFYWAKKAKSVTVVESDKRWSKFLKKNKTENMTVDYAKAKKDYINSIDFYNKAFDVIVIDGVYRKDCVKPALRNLKKGGFIILDNSEREIPAVAIFAKSKLVRIDFSGYSPINPYKSQTSFYLDKDYFPKYK